MGFVLPFLRRGVLVVRVLGGRKGRVVGIEGGGERWRGWREVLGDGWLGRGRERVEMSVVGNFARIAGWSVVEVRGFDF